MLHQIGEQSLSQRLAERSAQLGLASAGTTLAPGRIYWRVRGGVSVDHGDGRAEGRVVSIDFASHREALIAKTALERFGVSASLTEHELI